MTSLRPLCIAVAILASVYAAVNLYLLGVLFLTLKDWDRTHEF